MGNEGCTTISCDRHASRVDGLHKTPQRAHFTTVSRGQHALRARRLPTRVQNSKAHVFLEFRTIHMPFTHTDCARQLRLNQRRTFLSKKYPLKAELLFETGTRPLHYAMCCIDLYSPTFLSDPICISLPWQHPLSSFQIDVFSFQEILQFLSSSLCDRNHVAGYETYETCLLMQHSFRR